MIKGYMSRKSLMNRYDISKTTFDRWRENKGFPEPRFGEGKSLRLWAIDDVEAWEQAQFAPNEGN